MRSKILSILMAAALGSITASGHAAPPPTRTDEPEKTKGPATRLDPDKAYTKRRWVGMMPKGTERCPTVQIPGWKSETLLDLAIAKTRESCEKQYVKKSPPFEIRWSDRVLLHKLGLDRFCVYTGEPGSPDFQSPDGSIKPTMDRLALSITSAGGLSSSQLENKIWQSLANQFKRQTSQSTPEKSLALKGNPRVRLVFIDSHPDDEWPLERLPGSLHGFTLAHLAHGLVCPQGEPCAATIATRQALAYRDFNPDDSFPPREISPDVSGHVGVVSNLAAAILAEVLYSRQNEPDKKLILNLSLGWDGEAFNDLSPTRASRLEPSVRAVYDAIRFARRSGALVIAAAGNQRGGTDGTAWPLLPAAWELRRPTFLHLPFGHKPVFAVGGVDWQGLPLPNSRDGGRPRRVAYSDHSIARAEDGPTAMYTGTSVSAAVASSVAAVVWHLRPDLNPGQVMRLLTLSGSSLETKANFYSWKKLWLLSKLRGAPYGQQLSLPLAVNLACGRNGNRCPNLTLPPPSTRSAVEEPSLGVLLGELAVQNVKGDVASEDTLADLIDAASERWVFPQPEQNPCPGCTLVPQPTISRSAGFGHLYLEISDQWEGWVTENGTRPELQSATLNINCFDDDRHQTVTYSLDRIPFPSGPEDPPQIFRVDIQNDERLVGDCTAQITFKVKKYGREVGILNPVVVAPL